MSKNTHNIPNNFDKSIVTTTQKPDLGIVTGSAKKRRSFSIAKWSKKRKIITSLAAVVAISIIAGSATTIVLLNKKSPEEVAVAQQKAEEQTKIKNSNYDVLTPDEINTKIQNETGKTKDQLLSQSVDSSNYQDFNAAYEAARALYAVGDYQKAILAFDLAYKSVPGNVSYQFYNDYSAAADGVNDSAKAVEMMRKAADAIDKSNMSADLKKTKIDEINQKIQLRSLDGL